MNSYSILNIVAATPLEQFQILPLSGRYFTSKKAGLESKSYEVFPSSGSQHFQDFSERI